MLDVIYKIWFAAETNESLDKPEDFAPPTPVVIIYCCIPTKNCDINEV